MFCLLVTKKKKKKKKRLNEIICYKFVRKNLKYNENHFDQISLLLKLLWYVHTFLSKIFRL